MRGKDLERFVARGRAAQAAVDELVERERVMSLYRSLDTRFLEELVAAFELDRAAARSVQTVTFCDSRLAALQAVLFDRRVKARDDVDG